jgi:hypothetical protein
MPKPTEVQKRSKRYEELRKIGMQHRDAAIATFPEMNPEMAEVQPAGLPVVPPTYPAGGVSSRDLSREISAPGMSSRLVSQGMSQDVADAMAKAALDTVPQSAVGTDAVVNYDELDALETRVRKSTSDYLSSGAMNVEGFGKDVKLLVSSLVALTSAGQQGWYSFISGENMHDVADRLWPDVDIRDDDGTVEKKAMVPYTLAAIGTRISGQILSTFNVGPHVSMIAAARQSGENLINTQSEHMLTRQTVSEYNLMGYGAFANKLPLSGTKEREVYDQVIREEVSNEYMQWKYQDGLRGKAAMFLFPVFNAVGDLVEDPMILVSEAPKLMYTVARAALPVSTTARVTSAFARRTGRVSDLIVGVQDAEKWLAKSGDTLVATPTANNAARHMHAHKNVLRLKSDLAGAEQALSEKVRLRVAPRIHPDHIKPIADVYLVAPKATRAALTKEFIGKQTAAARKEVRALEKQIMATPGAKGPQGSLFDDAALGINRDDLLRQLDEAKTNRVQWVETRMSFNQRSAHGRGARTEDMLKSEVVKRGAYRSRVLYTGNDSSDIMGSLEKYLTSDLVPTKGGPPLKAMTANGGIVNAPRKPRAKTPELRLADANRYTDAALASAKKRLEGMSDETDFLREALDGLKKEGASQSTIDAATRELHLAENKQGVLEGWMDSRQRASELLKGEGKGSAVVEPGDPRKVTLRRIHENIQRGIAQGAPEGEIIQWEHLAAEVAAGRRVPANIMNRPDISPQQLIVDSLNNARRKALSADPTPVRDYGMEGDNATQLAQRLALGPDHAESMAEAARLLASGADLDDVTFKGLSVELYNSSYAKRVRPERSGEDLALVDSWMGEEAYKTKVETAQWQQTLAERMGDRFVAALYPNTWNLRAAGLIQNAREPMRVLQSVNPKMYTRVHNALHAQEYELLRMNTIFSSELEFLGVKVRVGKAGGGPSLGPEFIVDERKAKQFYELMNMAPNSDKYLDGLAALTEGEARSIRRIRQELDYIGNKLGIAETDKYIEGYVSHVFDRRWFDGGNRPPEFGDLGANAEIYMQQLLTRDGIEGYVPDLALALDTYARAASRKLHMEPLLQDLETAVSVHQRAVKGQDEWFVQYVNHMINNFKGKPTTLGQWVDLQGTAARAHLKGWSVVESGSRKLGSNLEKVGEHMVASGKGLGPGKLGQTIEAVGSQVIGKGEALTANGLPRYVSGDASRTAMGVYSLAYASVLTGSKRYFPMAVATGLATTGARYGLFNTLHGIMAMATPEGRALAKSAGIDRQWLQIMESPAWRKASEAASKAWVFGPSIHATENLVRGWTFHACLGDLMRKQGLKHWDDVVEAGLSNSFLHEAVRATEEVNHLFGQLGKPAAWGRFSRSFTAGGTQFLSFMPKQTEEILSQIMANPGYLGQYMMLSGAITRTGSEIGVDMSDYVGFGYLPGKVSDTQSMSLETLGSLVQVTGDMGNHMLGSGDPVKTKHDTETLSRNLLGYIPLYNAARQNVRTIQTLRTGQQFAGGELVRDVDIGQFEWDDKQGLLQNLSNIPQGFVPKPGQSGPTEMSSVLSSMNSLQGKLERQQFAAMRTNALEKTYYIERMADDLSEMVRTGNDAGFNETLTKMMDDGIFPSDIAGTMSREALKTVVPRLLREQMRDTRLMINNVEDMQRLNNVYDMQNR